MRSYKFSYYISTLIFGLIVFFGFGANLDIMAGVTGVTVSVTPTNFTGECPKVLTFTGRIVIRKTREGVNLNYRWIRSDGAKGPIKRRSIVRSGTQVVTSTWKLGTNGNSYRNYWMAIKIIPDGPWDRASDMTSNRAVFTLNCVNRLAIVPTPEIIPNDRFDLPVVLPTWEISGRIYSSPGLGCRTCLEGRKVKVILRKGSVVSNHIFTLDRNSSADYRFRSPFISAGTYTITIEKGPQNLAEYGNELNICFRGATPETRTVVLTRSRRKALDQDFQIAFSILWGERQPLCW